MKTSVRILAVCIFSLVLLGRSEAQQSVILSLAPNGMLTWSNAVLNSTCRVEWASSVAGPWQSSWDTLTNIVITNAVTRRPVPMFYRVVCELPPPLIMDLPATQVVTLLQTRASDPTFRILDVRTALEYSRRHIRGATNLDYYASTFAQDLNTLDKNLAWLVYCASGNRSGRTRDLMRQQGFREVYNMSDGFRTFETLTNALPWLEP